MKKKNKRILLATGASTLLLGTTITATQSAQMHKLSNISNISGLDQQNDELIANNDTSMDASSGARDISPRSITIPTTTAGMPGNMNNHVSSLIDYTSSITIGNPVSFNTL